MPFKNIGAFTKSDGSVVRTKDLSPEDQARVKQKGAMRDLQREGYGADDPRTKKTQQEINDIYAPPKQTNVAQDIADEISRRLNEKTRLSNGRR